MAVRMGRLSLELSSSSLSSAGSAAAAASSPSSCSGSFSFSGELSISAMLKRTLMCSFPKRRVSATSSAPLLSSMLQIPDALKAVRNSGSLCPALSTEVAALSLPSLRSYSSSEASFADSAASSASRQRSRGREVMAGQGQLEERRSVSRADVRALSPWLNRLVELVKLRVQDKGAAGLVRAALSDAAAGAAAGRDAGVAVRRALRARDDTALRYMVWPYLGGTNGLCNGRDAQR